jgi:hypothetical protein
MRDDSEEHHLRSEKKKPGAKSEGGKNVRLLPLARLPLLARRLHWFDVWHNWQKMDREDEDVVIYTRRITSSIARGRHRVTWKDICNECNNDVSSSIYSIDPQKALESLPPLLSSQTLLKSVTKKPNGTFDGQRHMSVMCSACKSHCQTRKSFFYRNNWSTPSIGEFMKCDTVTPVQWSHEKSSILVGTQMTAKGTVGAPPCCFFFISGNPL